ncbi:MAG: hypothetical protein K2M97_04835 [Muribaculaceae bacterium]|nr:hypothetical protein [Muribaculaceae bacterium]
MNILVPIFICAILPIAIVLIVYAASINRDNKNAQVLIKAIEANNGVDSDKLAEALRKPKKTEREILNQRLLRGCIFTLLGVTFGLIFAGSLSFGGGSETVIIYGSMLFGGVSLAIGISYLVVYFVTRKQIKD